MMTPDLIRRHQATAATMNKYGRKDFSWQRAVTCLHMGFFHLGRMGHRRPPIPPFRSPFGALRALKASGFKSTAEILDSIGTIRRIAPARALMGDIAVIAGTVFEDDIDDEAAVALAGIGGIAICGSSHRLFSWTQISSKPVVFSDDARAIHAVWRL